MWTAFWGFKTRNQMPCNDELLTPWNAQHEQEQAKQSLGYKLFTLFQSWFFRNILLLGFNPKLT